jgi:hypothetical protein
MIEKLDQIAKNTPVLKEVNLQFSDYAERLSQLFYNRATDYDCNSCNCDSCHSCDCNVCDCYG